MSKALPCALLTAMLLFGACGGDASPTASTPDGSPGASPTSRSPGVATTAGATNDDTDDPIDPAARATDRPLSDNALIRGLWLGFSEAWEDGPPGAERFLEENNYAPYQKDSDLCRKSDEDRGVQRKEFAYDDDTIKREENWSIPEGSLKGQKPQGRVYSMKIQQRVVTDEGRASVTGKSHVLIDDGKAYLFLDCARIAAAD